MRNLMYNLMYNLSCHITAVYDYGIVCESFDVRATFFLFFLFKLYYTSYT